MNQKSNDESREHPDKKQDHSNADHKKPGTHAGQKENMSGTEHSKKTEHPKGRTPSSKERGGIL